MSFKPITYNFLTHHFFQAKLSIVPSMGLSLVLLQTEHISPVAFKVSIVITAVLGLGTVEAGIVTPQVFLPHTPLIHK